MQPNLPGQASVCTITARIVLFVTLKKEGGGAFNSLLFNWDSHETLNTFSKMLKSYQAASAKSSNQLPCSAPAEPLLSGLHFLLLHCKCATACSHSPSISADANWFLSPVGWRQQTKWKSVQSQVNTIILLSFPRQSVDNVGQSGVSHMCLRDCSRGLLALCHPPINIWRLKSQVFYQLRLLKVSGWSWACRGPPSLPSR